MQDASTAKKTRRGLAGANPTTRKRVASAGGQAVQASGRAHILTPEERRRGGQHSPNNFSHLSQREVQKIARRGGLAAHRFHGTAHMQLAG